MALLLRPYQTDIINQVRSLMLQGKRRILIQAPTGSGKTALCANMVHSSEQKGLRSWFIVHRRELIKQSLTAFDKAGINPSVISNGFSYEPDFRAFICSINSLVRRLDVVAPAQLIVHDEAHHVAAKSWRKIIHQFPDAFHIGLTATPCRLDGKGLGEFFEVMVEGPKVRWLIDEGHLCDYRLFAGRRPDFSGVHTRMGDYVKSEVEERMSGNAIVGDAAAQYKKHANNKRAIVFAVSVEHSKKIAQQFRDVDIHAWHVDGETQKEERDWAIEQFKVGAIKVLCNVDLFGEGFDVPSLEAVILMRPTQSLGLHLQQVGRALRPMPGKKHAIILDHVGNWERHGLPDDVREWSLEGRNKEDKQEVKCKECPRCYNVQPVGSMFCQECGLEFPRKMGGREYEEVEGELVEINPALLEHRRRREAKQKQSRARTVEELTAIGIERGYGAKAARWAQHVFQSRLRRKGE